MAVAIGITTHLLLAGQLPLLGGGMPLLEKCLPVKLFIVVKALGE